jgi:hypothetical protein
MKIKYILPPMSANMASRPKSSLPLRAALHAPQAALARPDAMTISFDIFQQLYQHPPTDK